MKPRTPCRLRVSLVLLTLRFAPGLSESRVAHYAHVQLDAVRETLTVDGKQRSFVWQAPGRAPPAGLMLLVRGCDHPEDEHGWPPSASCPKCQSLPEEEYIVRAALDARLLVASPAPAGFCPELDADLPLIVELLRSLQGRAASPLRLFATGSSSGGRIVARLPSRLPADLALSAFSPSCANPAARLLLPVVGGGLPPPSLWVHMPRDRETAVAVHAAVAALRAAGGVAETLDVHPLPVYPEFFSDRITGMAVVGSRAAQRALLNGGLLFADNLTLTEPHRGRMQLPAWVAVHKDVWAASGSDAVMHGWMYSELETAYGFHAKTADVMPEMLAFFRRHGLERAHDPDV